MASVICMICQDSEITEWSALTCGHVFHHACLATWLGQSATCPYCNRPPPPPSSSVMRIYFATEDDRNDHQHRQRSPEGAAGADLTDDPHEMEQLRQMLFMEAQERDVAWKQAEDSEKIIVKLRIDQSREAQQMASEFENCQMAMIRREEQIDEVMRLAALEQRENQDVINQLQLANRCLEENKTQLSQQLLSAEQRNRTLRAQLDTLQASGNATAARLQTRQTDMERHVTQLEASINSCKRQLESEQRIRQIEAEQLLNSLTENSLLTAQLSQAQTAYTALRSAANEEVNKQKELNSNAQTQIKDLEARFLTASDGLSRAERERASLADRLRATELRVCELQMQAQRQQSAHDMAKLSASGACLNQSVAATAFDEEATGRNRSLSFVWHSEKTKPGNQDNFADFPVFAAGDSAPHRVQQQHPQPPAPRAPQGSAPNLLQASQQEDSWPYELSKNLYVTPPATPPGLRRAGSTWTELNGGNTDRSSKKKEKEKGSRKCRQM